eukprot:tig00000981_g5873.t1
MPLFETIPIDQEEVKRIAKEHWGLELGACLKASQNHTFKCTGEDGEPRALRVTPDPSMKRDASFEVEASLLSYVSRHGLPVCAPIPSRKSGASFVREGSLLLCAFPWARGDAVNYFEWKWLTEQNQVEAVGSWLARFHVLSRRFAREHPEIASKARDYTELHEGCLAGAPVSPEDAAARGDAAAYGVLHGDVNPSNFHWDAAAGEVVVFDWDQVERAWFLYDLAQPIWGVVMLAGAGSPLDHSKVPEADVARYTDQIVAAYERGLAAAGEPAAVDRGALGRMVELRREFYYRFCRRAVGELDADSFMGKFCNYIVRWIEGERAGGPRAQ